MSWVRRHKLLVANLGLILVLVIGVGYLLISVVRYNPLEKTYAVTVEMARSGGLQTNNDVTLRGSRVGKVTGIELSEQGVSVTAELDSKFDIPLGGTVTVESLSAAGEQYIDFRPESNDAPFLADGAVISADQVETPVPLSDLLDHTSTLIAQIDPAEYKVVLDELYTALGGGPDQLKSVITGLSVTMAGLDSLLPQTTSLIGNLRVMAATTSQIQPDLSTLTRNTGVLFDQLTAADQEVRRLLELGPGQLATVGGVVADTADPLTNLVTNFVAIAQSARLRTPALAALFPSLRDGSLALGIPAHDNEFNALADIWVRPTCDYDTPPRSPADVTEARVPLWNYCVTNNPNIQIRGSANAPRPDVPNNGASIPPDVDPKQMSTPLPPIG
jgi:phospholipid/cholesterol/gamma-HCH transport system substrate-binding protein